MKILSTQYIKSVTLFEEREQFKDREICFIGRSNVGKSSMINKLVMQKVARTSSTPGATRMINIYRMFYELNGEKKSLILSDFPGFGYSKVSKKTYQGWQGMIDTYIRKNGYISRLIWVFDVRRDMDEIDRNVIAWIHHLGLSFTLAVTKIDKLSKNDLLLKKKSFERNFGSENVFPFSSKDGYGREMLLSHMMDVAAR